MTGDDDKDRQGDRFERTVERLLKTPPQPRSAPDKLKEPKPKGRKPKPAKGGE